MSIREVVEGRQVQGNDEKLPWAFDFEHGAVTLPLTSPVVVVYDITDGSFTDVTNSTLAAGTPSINNYVVTLPLLQALTATKRYRVECKVTGANGAVEELFCFFDAER